MPWQVIYVVSLDNAHVIMDSAHLSDIPHEAEPHFEAQITRS
jgi:hypothetical protein